MLEVAIIGNASQLQSALGKANAQVATFGSRMEAAGKKISSVGKTMTRDLTLPIVGAGVVATKFAIDFQSQMEMIHTQAGASTAEVKKMTQAVLDLATKTPQGPAELAKGLFHIESVGYRGAKALDVLKTAALGAAVGNASLEDTASALSAVMVTNIKGTKDYHHAMGILNATVGAGNMRMGDLVEALKSGIVPTAKVAGLSLQGLAAGMAMLTDEGVPAGIAANRLRTALLMITNPTKKALAALQSVGLHALTLGHDLQKPDGLMVALRDLQKHMAAIHDPTQRLALLGNLFGGSKSAGTMAMLINNLGRVQMKYDQIGKTAGNFNKDVVATQATELYKLRTAWSAIHAALIRFGSIIGPVIANLAQSVAGLAQGFGRMSPATQKLIIIGLGLVAVLGPLLAVIGNVTVAVKFLATGFKLLAASELLAAGPITIIIAALAAIALGFIIAYKRSETFRVIVNAVWAKVQAAFTVTVAFIRQHWQLMLAILTGGFSTAAMFVINHWGTIKHVANVVVGFIVARWGNVKQVFTFFAGWVRKYILGPIQWIIDKAKAAASLVASIAGFFGGSGSASTAASNRRLAAQGGAPAANMRLAAGMLPRYGMAASQINPLITLWNNESGWSATAYNSSSGAQGIPQFLPMAGRVTPQGFPSTPPINAGSQIGWGLGYIRGRYGTPGNALAAWESRSPHWYDQGGVVPGRGPRMAVVHGGETILPTHRNPRGGTIEMHFHFGGVLTGTEQQVVSMVRKAIIQGLRTQGPNAFVPTVGSRLS